MKCKALLVLFAVILSAAAAPVSDVNSEEALLQAALDDEVDFGVDGVKKQDADKLLNLIDFGVELVKRLNDVKSSEPGTKLAQTARHFFSLRDSANTNIPTDISRGSIDDDLPHILPVPQPDSDESNQPNKDGPDSSAVRNSLCGSTNNPCTQRFLPRDVQEHYNKMTKDDLTAETEAIGAILAGAWKALKAFKAIKSLIPKSGSKSGSNSGSDSGSNFGFNFGGSTGTSILDRLPNGSPSQSENRARNFLGFPDDIGRTGIGGGSRNELPLTENGEPQPEDGEQLEDAEIEKFKTLRSILGKTLRVVNHKLKPRNRTPSQDRQAVNNPTGWKDLGRNVLGIVGDKLDPAQRRQAPEGENAAQKQVTLEVQTKLGHALNELGRFSWQHTPDTETGAHEESLRQSRKRRNRLFDLAQNLIEELKRSRKGADNPTEQTPTDGVNEAEIEGINSLLSNVLYHFSGSTPTPTSTAETPLDDRKNSEKWKNIGRNLMRLLRGQLKNANGNTPRGGGVKEMEDAGERNEEIKEEAYERTSYSG